MPLLMREAVGGSLRRTRISQNRTLRDVATKACISVGYLSEVERGQKEPSSELLFAICSALDVPLSKVFFEVADILLADEILRLGSFVTREKTSDLLSV